MAKRRYAPTFVIDSTPWSCVARCLVDGCAWRAFTHTKPSAYRLLADHRRRAHNDPRGAWFIERTARSDGQNGETA